MVCHAFVVRMGQDILLEFPLSETGTICEATNHSEVPATFGHRMVYGFFQGHFSQQEVENYMQRLAETIQGAPEATQHFEVFDAESKCNTGGITVQTLARLPQNITAMMEEYSQVKFITENAFEDIQVEWYDSLKAMQSVQLPRGLSAWVLEPPATPSLQSAHSDERSPKKG